ncbi:MAG: methyltransferase domain-containing protein [Chloroflexi bacterium]|nr:methyltransferase domain-containing protein [Chloroflexota bacterium]
MKLPRQLFFNFWYFLNPPWDTNITPPELIEFIEQHPPGRALDLGCGTGTNAITLAQHGWDATDVDFAAKAIRAARRKAKRAAVDAQFLVQDVTKLDNLQQPFDLILDIGCFHNIGLALHETYIVNLDRLLAPGGSFLIYAYFRDWPNSSGPGVVEADLERFSPPLELISRQNGTERGIRPSVWLLYRKPNP